MGYIFEVKCQTNCGLGGIKHALRGNVYSGSKLLLITKLFLFTSLGRASESCCWLRIHCLSSEKAEGSSSSTATQGGKKTLNVILPLLLISVL